MEKAHLVERRTDPRDQRISRIYLSPQGRNLRGQVDCVTAQVTHAALAGFSVAEQEQLSAYIHRIIHNLQPNSDASEIPTC